MSLAQKGYTLLREAIQDISFGSPEIDLIKKFNTNCCLYSMLGKEKSFKQKDKIFRNFYLKFSKQYNNKVNAIVSAEKQAKKAANMANKYSKLSNNIILDYYDDIENKIYDKKYKKRNLSKKRNSTTNLNNKYKKRKYNLTVRTDFQDWKDFTNYIKSEKNNMKQ